MADNDRVKSDPRAEVMLPVTLKVADALDEFWTRQTPERLKRLLDLWHVGADVRLVIQYGPGGVLVDVGQATVEITDPPPEPDTGMYL